MKFHALSLYRRTRLLLAAMVLPLTSAALFSQAYGPLTNVELIPADYGVAISWDYPEGYDPLTFNDPRITGVQYKRDGGEPVVLPSVRLDAPLEPATTYQYELYGVDSTGNQVTSSVTQEVSTLPAGHGLTTSRVSFTTTGDQRPDASLEPMVSGNGRYVVYSSYDGETSENLGDVQIFRHDQESGETIVVSRNADGDYADDTCSVPVISDDGRYVSFISKARNLSPEDSSGFPDVYLYDHDAGTVALVSDAPGVGSSNGFTTGSLRISGDGSTVAFISDAKNLHEDAADGNYRGYLYNSLTTELVLIPEPSHTIFQWDPGSVSQLALSGDGSLVVLTYGYRHTKGFAGSLSILWQFDRTAGENGEISPLTRKFNNPSLPAASITGSPTVSSDGRYVAFAWTGTRDSNDKILDEQSDYAKSIGYHDGHKAGFVLDRQTDSLEVFTLTPYGTTTGNLNPGAPISISDDGRYVAYFGINTASQPTVIYHPDGTGGVIVHDRALRQNTLVSRSTSGDFTETGYQKAGTYPSISADGTVVAYQAGASNLAPGDTNNVVDIFITELDLAPPDLNSPTWLDGAVLETTNIGATLVDLAWSEATDVEGPIGGYRIFGDGEVIANTGAAERTLQIPGLDSETTYLFKVEALDGSGNITTDGPQVEVTTKALSNGNATLSAPALDGGNVDLAWDPAEETVLGYIIERRTSGGDWEQAAEVGSAVTTYLDGNLPADTTVAYRILKTPTSGDPLVHSQTVEVTTKALSIASVGAGLLFTANSRSTLTIGGDVDLRMNAEAGRTGRANITVETWIDADDPSQGTSSQVIPVDLTELSGTPGLYTATWTLPDGTANLVAINGTLMDGFGSSIDQMAIGFPLPVEAKFSINVNGASEDFDRGLVFSLWSEANLAGCSRVIAGSATIEKGGLPPGDDYRLRIIQGNRVVRDLSAVSLRPGLETTIDESLEPATPARFILKDPDGKPRGGFLIGTYEKDSGRFIGWGEVADDGTVDAAPGVLFAPGSEITYRLQREPWDIDDGPLTATIPSFGETGTLDLEWGPYFVRPGSIAGTVVDSEGSPVEASITAISGNEGIQEVTRIGSSPDGSFTIDPAYATANVTAEKSIWDSDAGQWTKLVGKGQFEVPENGGLVDAGEIRLEPVLKVEFIVRSLDLVYPDATVRQLRPGADPLADHISLKVIRPGFLRSDARASGNSEGLSLTVEYPADTEYILTVYAGAIGFGTNEIRGTVTAADSDTDGVIRVEIESLELLPASDSWVTAQLMDHDGLPLSGDTAWTASTIRDQILRRGSYQGRGPDLQLPTAVGSGRFRLTLNDQPDLVIATPLVAQEGTNDLGDLQFSASGRFRTSDALSLSTAPRLLGPGQNVRTTLRVRNLQNTPIENGRASIQVPEGLEPVEETVMIESEPATASFSDQVLTIETGSLQPADSIRVYVEFERTEAFDAESISLFATFGYSAPEGQVEEQVGSDPIEVILRPTITGPTQVSGRNLVLKGRAPNGFLRIFDGSEVIGSRRVSSQGYWTEAVTLVERRIPYWHTITAQVITKEGEEIVSEPFDILHHPGAPGPRKARMRQLPALNDPEAVGLLKRFPDVVETTEWDIGPEVPRFWRRILAGFPFAFELEFDQPELVDNLAVSVAGPGGGTATATAGDDGVFRATIESDRNGWSTGPISIAYSDGSEVFPKWGNQVVFGEIIELPEAEPEAGIAATGPGGAPLQYDGSNAYIQGGSVSSQHRDLESELTYRVWPVEDYPDSSTATIDYPGDQLSYPAESVRFRNASADYSISGNRFQFSVKFYVDYEQYLAKETTAPAWPADASVGITDPTGTSVRLKWPRALDELWIQEYVVSLNGEETARIPGGIRNTTIGELSNGSTYQVSIVAIDGAGKSSPALQTELQFQGASTQALDIPPTANAEKPTEQKLQLEEALRAASLKGVETLGNEIDLVGRLATPIDILSLLKDYFDAYNQVDRWNDMIDAMDECGVSPALKDKVNQDIGLAAAALAAKTMISHGATTAGIAATATGAGAPVGAAFAIGGLVGGFVAGEVAEHTAGDAEKSFKEAMGSIDECEDPSDPPKPRKSSGSKTSTIADPTWKIDPSGFVYEVTEDNRLAGVTATLLDGENENGPWIVSDAEEFGEINPQVTPEGGTYRWDVPAGWWRVMYQKEGYETRFSDALPVPPPHFDVNIPLKSLAPPEVTAVDSLNNGAALEVTFANYIRAGMASPATIRVRTAGGSLIPGQVYAPSDSLVDNPHTETTAKDITERILFVPTQRLTIGDTYTVEVDGVIESYGEIPMGETAAIDVTILDSFAGTWFGTFDPGGGVWTAHIDEDRAIALVGFDPETGKRFSADGTVAEDGTIKLNMEDLDESAVLTGSLVDGVLNGAVSILGYTATGTRSLGEVAVQGTGLTYQGAVIGSKGTTVTATVGPDGTTLVVIEGDLATAAVVAALDSQGQFSGFLSDGSELELDLSDLEGAMSGVLSLVDSGPWSVLGAAEGTQASRLVNVSGRGPVTAGAGSLIAGFVIRGTAENPMLVRAIGPGLETFGLTGVLEQPRIRLVDPSRPVDDNLLAENTNWLQGGNRNELRAIFAGLGAFFLEDAKSDAIVYLPIEPGPYTAVVQGVDGQAGIALVEAYDADLGVFGTTSEGVANLSLRGNVASGSGVMIAGFVIDGGSPRRLLIRGVGPGLGPLGVQGFLADPTITLFEGNNPISDNQSWGDYLPDEGLAPIFQTVGAFPLESGSDDAAIVIWLAPGPYTVRLKNEVIGEGIGLIELYDLP